LAPRSHACETYPTPLHNFQSTFRGINGFNNELGDYGLIFEDAKLRDCDGGSWNPKQGAYAALVSKINTTGWHYDALNRWVGPFGGFLEGGHVALIFASALMIGGHGDLDTNLDNLLKQVRDSYVYNPGPGCGFYQQSGWLNGGDTCMEEHAAAALAYGWIAAYESQRRGWMAGYGYSQSARSHIHSALSTYDSTCISDLTDPNYPVNVNTRGPCNIDTADMTVLNDKLLPDPNTGITKADVLSFNRNENIVYGAGLMTLLSGALIGLEEGGYSTSLSSDEQLIAAAFLDEAQRKSDPSGASFKGSPGSSYAGTCSQVTLDGSNHVVRQDIYGCADGLAQPTIYNLTSRLYQTGYSSFYERYVGNYTPRTTVVDHRVVNGQDYYDSQPAYQFNTFNESLFTRDANDSHLNWGRESVYKVLGWTWNTIDYNRYNNNTWNSAGDDKRPRLWANIDDYNPIGYLDSIDANGVAYGWTCDQDQPNTSIPLDFYVDGGGLGTFVLRAWTGNGNEQAVSDLCGGGYYHRFATQLPAWTKGHYVYAWGLDATWRGVYNLPGWQCPTAPACVW